MLKRSAVDALGLVGALLICAIDMAHTTGVVEVDLFPDEMRRSDAANVAAAVRGVVELPAVAGRTIVGPQ